MSDLIAYIDAPYRTIAKREGRASLSLRGLAAMKFALRYPEKFAWPNVHLHENDLLVKAGFVSAPLELRNDL